MNYREEKPVVHRAQLADRTSAEEEEPQPEMRPIPPEQRATGWTVLRNWCLMLAGLGAIVLAAQWLAG